MSDRTAGLERLARTAQRQSGVFTVEQATEAGVPRSTVHHWLATNRLVRVLPHVCRFPGFELSPEGLATAAWLSCGDPAALRGLSAAALWGLSVDNPPVPQVVVPAGRNIRREAIDVTRTRRWSATDMVMRGPVRVTAPMRTLLDLASVHDEADLEVWLDEAHRLRLVELGRFLASLEAARRRGLPGADRLRRLVAQRDPESPIESPEETRLFRRLRLAGLPRPVPQVWVETRSGRRRIDLAYPPQRVALELDSFRWHQSRAKFDDDRIRGNELADLGWSSRHITSTMLDDPTPLVELTVASALGLRPVRWRPA